MHSFYSMVPLRRPPLVMFRTRNENLRLTLKAHGRIWYGRWKERVKGFCLTNEFGHAVIPQRRSLPAYRELRSGPRSQLMRSVVSSTGVRKQDTSTAAINKRSRRAIGSHWVGNQLQQTPTRVVLHSALYCIHRYYSTGTQF